ncbi:hypothetical protein CDIK_4119 [Cucumispora dikerogammari]|nr:hypothetical protein CDIK_4119 [Cucumispora dikerogammari]
MIESEPNDIRDVFDFKSDGLYSTTISKSDDRGKTVEDLMGEKIEPTSESSELAEEYTFSEKKDFVGEEKLFVGVAKTSHEFFRLFITQDYIIAIKIMTNRHVHKKGKVGEKIKMGELNAHIDWNSIFYDYM